MNTLLDGEYIGILGVILAALTLVAAVAIPLLLQRRAQLSYRVLLQSRLISVSDEIQRDLTIFFRDEEIEDAALVVFEFSNTGTVAIRPKDFYERVSFGFGKTARILNAEVVDVIPKGLRIGFQIEDGRIELEPLLLNKGDSARFKVVLSSFAGGIDVRGRVLDVKRIAGTYKLRLETDLTLWQQLRRVSVMFLLWLGGAGSILVGIAFLVDEQPTYFRGVSIILIGVSVWLISIISNVRGYENWMLFIIVIFPLIYCIALWANWFLGTPIF